MLETEEGGGGSFPRLPYSLLAIDLGEVSGIAGYFFGRLALFCGSTKDPLSLLLLTESLLPNEILLERFPEGRRLSHEIESVYGQLAMKSILISPGEWKPFMKSRKSDFPQAKTQHEKDAINMLRYYLIAILGREDIG